MIKAILVSAMLICSIANAQETKQKRPPVSWKEIHGMNIKGGKIYIDVNSLNTLTSSSSRNFNSADVMVSFDKETIALSDKKTLMFRSKVHTLVIDCETGNAAPVMDLYFKEPLPERSSKPLGGEKYPPDASLTMYTMDKKSIMFNILCPSYI